jgi:anti-anti-sigma factor
LAQEPGTTLAVRDEWDGDVAIVTVEGEIDMTTAGVLSGCLGRVVQKNPERLVIDLAGVSFLDSSAVHAIVRARHALPGECPVVLRSARRQARRLFELTGLNSVCVLE